jgi:enamine deaminase RidA (YjgF/YER057c/UK114 family)
MSRDVILPDQSKASYDNFHFAPAVRSSKGLVFCSGQIGVGKDGEIPEAPEEEFRNAWAAVGQVLHKAGLNYDNIIEFTSFHVGLQQHLAEFMKVKDEVITSPWPAWTAIGISELAVPGARVEIRVVAE